MTNKKKKYVYFFGSGKVEGTVKMREILGGKGANLADMTSIGLPVPPGFTISTEACAYYSANDGAYPEGLREEILEHLATLEEMMGAKLGDETNPLLVSVRSGAASSMPGMMDDFEPRLNPKSVQVHRKMQRALAWTAIAASCRCSAMSS